MAKKSKSEFPSFVFSKGRNTEVRGEFSEFKGKHLINLREWFEDRDSGEMRPGKGFTVSADKAEDFLSSLIDWATELKDNLPDLGADDEADEFEVGEKVQFKDEDGDVVVGVITKIKGGSAIVEDDDEEDHKVKLAKLSAYKKPKKEKAAKKSTKKDAKPVKAGKKKSKKEDLVDLDDDEEAPKKKSKKDGKKKKRGVTHM